MRMENVTGKKRNSSFELLRILALLLIFWMHGSSSYSDNELSAWLCIIITTIGNIGVSLFILISGYYGIHLNVKKMIKLDLMLIFYGWAGLALQYIWGTADALSGSDKLTYLMPVIGRYSWYFTCYFVLAFLSPFLNEFIESLSRERFRQLLITMLVIFSGITTFFFFDVANEGGGKGIIHMTMLYLIGRYIRLYKEEKTYKTGKLFVVFAMVSGINILLNGGIYLVTGVVQNKFARDCTLFTILEAVCIFLIFRNFYFENRFINTIAKYVPAIFMMEWTLRNVITNWMFNYLAWRESNWHELILLGTSVLLVALGSMIEFLRRLLLHWPEEKLSNLIYSMWCLLGKKISKKIS